ncbi:MAG: CGNR zinc finger domain-containing protein [Gordonia sp. (in: high G+C Gram-positive bacteria)]
MATGTVIDTHVWLTPADGRRWRFDPGSPSLAFAYSGDLGYGIEAWESLHSPADVDAWLHDRFGPLRAPCDDAAFLAATALRSAITWCARAAAADAPYPPADVDLINEWAARPAIAPHLPGGTRAAANPTVAQVLSAIAADAVTTFGTHRELIRVCAADDCGLLFVDTSRPRNRRWCSMRRCGGRAKSRAHQSRRRGEV